MKIRNIWLCSWLLLLLTACVDAVDSEVEERIPLPVYLSVPMEEVAPPSRVWGDPGAPGMEFKLPKYLYIFVVVNEPDTENYWVEKWLGNGELYPDMWVEDRQASLWRYTGDLIVLLSSTNFDLSKSKVYAITSACPLKFNTPTTKEEVEQLQLDLAQQPAGFNIIEVYANTVADPQNGAIVVAGREMRSNVTCYHIAARVDIQWNIAPAYQKEYAMSEIWVTGIPQVGYVFQPTKNAAGDKSEGFFDFNIGNQWYGRTVFYSLDKQEVNCAYKLRSLTDPPGADFTQQKTYPAATDANGSTRNYASWYRINARFGYTP